MRRLLLIVGLIALAIGLLWIGQGTGAINWPASSFMIRQIQWAGYGAALAARRPDPDLAEQALGAEAQSGRHGRA